MSEFYNRFHPFDTICQAICIYVNLDEGETSDICSVKTSRELTPSKVLVEPNRKRLRENCQRQRQSYLVVFVKKDKSDFSLF